MEKTALITGASRGLGAAMAKRLAQDGFSIAINCYNEAEREQDGNAVAEYCRSLGVEAECFLGDVSSGSDCEQMVVAVKERFGSIDVLVNNAGITRDGLLVRMSEADFDAVTNVNYKSVFYMTKQVGLIMMRQRSGRIINVSSVAGVHGNAGQFNYAAAKAGIIGMTKSAAKELGGRGITVNAIAPGFINTAMTATLPDQYKQAILKQIALKRYGEPEEVAGVVSFLAGKDAGYINGQVIVIDGCLSM